MEKPESLLACPFCGDAGSLTQYGRRPEIWCVECPACGAEGGRNSTPELSITAWNRRAGANGALNDNRAERLAPASWLDALAESIESAEKIKVLYEPDGELYRELLLLQENLKELRRQIRSRI